jgi:hypothetical protein
LKALLPRAEVEECGAKVDYLRGKPRVSLQVPSRLWITVAAAAWAVAPLPAQYPGQITNPGKDTPRLRAVAVLEWTGDKDHPKATRLIPVSIFDGQELEDAGVYLARPEPLALEGQVEYQLQLDGKPIGLFDVESSGEQLGSWVGFGKWKALPVPKAPAAQMAKVDEDDVQSDVPVLHRKHHTGDSGSGSSNSGSGSGSGSGPSGPPPDPDRPTLHKGGDAGDSNSGGSAGGSNGSGGSTDSSSNSSGTSSSAPVDDPDRPTLHKGGDAAGSASGNSSSNSSQNSSSGPPPDPDRPTMQRSDNSANSSASNNSEQSKKKKSSEDEGYVEDVATVTDPERPHLFRGKAEGYGGPVLPSLMGMPADMQQVVGVSDLKSQPAHPWDYTWANPDDADKMKAAMEEVARTALGLNPPPAAPAKSATKTAAAHKTSKPAPPPPEPAPLVDEQFRIFELAYGSGATMVLSAHTNGADGPMKFVTLIGQPDLYGNVAVLVKNVTDAKHLDETPRMHLVDAVDAMADNRGELLFELRGASQRQFALYRVLRGQATRIFVSGGEAIGTPTGE